MAGLLDFQNPDSLAQLGLIGGLLTATKGSNWPLMLHQAAQAQERRKLMQADEQQRLAQAEQMRRQQAEQDKRAQAFQALAEQRPDLAQLLQLAPEVGLQRAFPAPEKPQAYTLGPGQARFEGGKQVAAVPAERKAPEGMQYDESGRLVAIPGYVQMRTQIAAAGRPQVTTNVMPPRETFKDSMALKKDFDAQPEVKGFKEVQGAWDQISTALKNPSAANDLAAATKFMKLLDPGSVVRESELAMAMQASGALDRMANYHNLLLRGQKLTPTQRQDFYKSGEALYGAAKGRYEQTVKQYEGIAEQYKLDRQFIPPAQGGGSGGFKFLGKE